MLDPLIAKRVQLVGLDVDGVMTDGGVYVGVAGGEAVELKRFDIRDNIGIRFLRVAGVKVVVVSGRVSEATRVRCEELGVDAVIQDDQAQKLSGFLEVLSRFGTRIKDCAFVGDDLPDLPIMRRVGLAVAVANAMPEILAVSDYRTEASGGRGAIREFAEELLRARGQWEDVLHQYLAERGDRVGRGIGAG
jgi:3-deoxy-D-manno-octulosonate 8-phosphate phosphatase (KDO 8-P phosphatase)